MRLLRPASEDDMVAVFLAAEVTSERYGPQITEILARLGHPRGIVEQPDARDEAANATRRQILAAYRHYPSGDVFTGMPADVTWHHAALTPAELGHRPLHRLPVLDRVLRRHPAGRRRRLQARPVAPHAAGDDLPADRRGPTG